MVWEKVSFESQCSLRSFLWGVPMFLYTLFCHVVKSTQAQLKIRLVCILCSFSFSDFVDSDY